MSQAVQHLNISVYEIQEVIKSEGSFEGKPLFKQQNNPLPVLSYSATRLVKTTMEKLLSEVGEETEVLKIFPCETYDDQSEFACTLVTGLMVKSIPADPTQPIIVEGTEEEQFEARLKALQNTDVVVPFIMIIPETDRYMFDLTLSHIPDSAISKYVEAAEVIEGEDIPMAIDPLGMHMGCPPEESSEE